jgi:hypothetical protein
VWAVVDTAAQVILNAVNAPLLDATAVNDLLARQQAAFNPAFVAGTDAYAGRLAAAAAEKAAYKAGKPVARAEAEATVAPWPSTGI